MTHTTDRITRLERTNRRLTLALVALGGMGVGAVLAGFAQPAPPAPPAPEWVGIAIHDDTNFLYRMDADGGLERLSLGRGRVAGGGTPAVWNDFRVGTEPRSP